MEAEKGLGNIKDERVQSSGGGDNEEEEEEEEAPLNLKQDVLLKVPFKSDLENPSMELVSVPSASNSTWKEEDGSQHDKERIKRTKVEMREVREENERLKKYLDEIVKDYETLKRKFHEMMNQQIIREGKKSTQTSGSTINNNDNNHEEEVDDHMVSLTLARFSTSHQNKNNTSSSSLTKLDHNHQNLLHPKQDYVLQTPSSIVDHNLQSPTHSEPKEDEAGQTWTPSKMSKPGSLPSPAVRELDEVSQQNPPKKARVCVRARCDTPTMNDGCQWRKYGQKIAKGNPCPRAYYRCTGAPTCPVRKQVQRSIDDISILITTYEGTHNHPLPVSAMAMASTTSAAVSMLLSGASSSTSQPGLNPSFTATATAANLHGMNMYLSNNNTNSKQFYLPNSSMLSSSLNHPTITLDLTSNPPSTSSSSFHNNNNNNIPSINNNNSYYSPKYPFTSLDFCSSQPNFMAWNNNNNNNSGYNIIKNNNPIIGMSADFAKQLPLHSNVYQTYLQQFSKSSTTPTTVPLIPDTIAAATKAITSDPSFQSALVAALSSIIGGGNGSGETGGPISSLVGGGEAGKSLTCSTSKSSPCSSPGNSRENGK